MEEDPRQRLLHGETSRQDSDEQPGEQSCPCVEPKDPEEVDEPKGPGQPPKPIAHVRPMRCEASEPTEPSEAAGHHAGRRIGQVQRAHSRRWRHRPRHRQWQRTEGGSHWPAAFWEWQGYFNGSEGPYPDLGTDAGLSLSTFIPMGLVPVGVVQQPPMVYGNWVVMGHQVFITYYYLIPMAGTVSYFMQPSFRLCVYRVPGFLTFPVQ